MCTGAQQDELEGLAAAYGSSGLEESAQDRDLEERVERHVVYYARAGGQASVRSRACTTLAEAAALAGGAVLVDCGCPFKGVRHQKRKGVDSSLVMRCTDTVAALRGEEKLAASRTSARSDRINRV